MKYRNFGRKIHCLPIKWTSGLLGIVRCIPCSRNKGNIVIRNLTGKKEESKKRKWNLFLDRINVNVYTSVYSGSNVEETSKPARGRGAKPWDRESYSETAAAILVNWDCPVWKCGNLVSTGRTFDPWATATHRACGPIVSRFTIESSSVPTRMSRNVVTTLGVSTLASKAPSCTRCVYLPPSLLLIPLSLFLPLPFVPQRGHADELLTRATTGRNSLRGLSTSKEPLHLCHTVPYLLSQSEPSNSTARYLQFQWNLSTRVEHPSHRGFATWPKFTSLFPPN